MSVQLLTPGASIAAVEGSWAGASISSAEENATVEHFLTRPKTTQFEATTPMRLHWQPCANTPKPGGRTRLPAIRTTCISVKKARPLLSTEADFRGKRPECADQVKNALLRSGIIGK